MYTYIYIYIYWGGVPETTFAFSADSWRIQHVQIFSLVTKHCIFVFVSLSRDLQFALGWSAADYESAGLRNSTS